MLKKIIVLGLTLLIASSSYALNSEDFSRALKNYSKQLAKLAIVAKESKKTGNYGPYEDAMESTDKAANVVVTMINKIETQTEADVAKYLIEKFRKEAPEHQKAARLAKKMLLVKTNYIHAPQPMIVRNQQKDNRSYVEVALEALKKEQAMMDPRKK